jgi:hypothetical protein
MIIDPNDAETDEVFYDAYEAEMSQYDNDPSPYDGNYSEE